MTTKVFLISLLGLIISCSSPAEKEAKKEEANKSETEQKAARAQEELEQKVERFNKYVSLECLGKSYEKHDQQEFIHYKFRITNKTEKDVESMRGKISFTNKQGNEIKGFTMAYAEPIKAGEDAIWEAETAFDQFMDDEEALMNLDLKKLDCHWEPLQISFADGSIIE